MSDSVVVREYAELTTALVQDSPDRAHIPESCFNWLLEKRQAGDLALKLVGRGSVKLDSYVGFLQSPCGTSIEILPKHFRHCPTEDELISSRKILIKMIAANMQLPYREIGPADIQLLKQPLHEWIYAKFLLALDTLYKKGLRFNYQQVDEESRFLRGRLNTGRQLRQPPGRGHLFQIRHEIFTADRPENRLIKLALELARNQVKESSNWRLANELSHLLSPIPSSRNYEHDFRAWKDNRLMVSYRDIKAWCELIVRQMNPVSQKGYHQGISLLFPMERLFENYVAQCLEPQLIESWQLKMQASSKYLCHHQPVDAEKPRNMFQLRPDLMLVKGDICQVMDTKWKLIDENKPEEKYGVSQSDFYQMFAYGQKYMDGAGDMVLIYPFTDRFSSVLPAFQINTNHRLWAIPFDLDQGALVAGYEDVDEVVQRAIKGLQLTSVRASDDYAIAI